MHQARGAIKLDPVNRRCPACRVRPPALAACDACLERFDPLASAGVCPRCAAIADRLLCQACGAFTALEEWPERAGDRDALAEQLRPPEERPAFDPITGTTEAPAPDESLSLRAAVLVFEERLALSRAAAAELATLRPADSDAAARARRDERLASAARGEAELLRRLARARCLAEHAGRAGLPDRRPEPAAAPGQEEAAEGMRLQGVRCPGCGWRPDLVRRWRCDCQEPFHALLRAGRCPACPRRWARTDCPACDAWALRTEWGLGPDPPEPPRRALATPAATARLTRVVADLARRWSPSAPASRAVLDSASRAAGLADLAWGAAGNALEQATNALQAGDGSTRIKARDWTGAIEETSAALRRTPDAFVPLAHRGQAYTELGQIDEALQDLSAALRQAAPSGEARALALASRAHALWLQAEFPAALADALEAVAHAPYLPLTWYWLAWARWSLGAQEAALSDLGRTLQLRQRSRTVLEVRASLRLQARQPACALADATEALERGRLTVDLFAIRSGAALLLGDLTLAEQDATRALRLSGGDFLPAYALRANAATREKQGCLRALEDLARLAARDPHGWESRHWGPLSLQAHFAGRPERARALAGAWRAASPSPSAWLWQALILDDLSALPASDELRRDLADDWSRALLRLARGETDREALLPLAQADPGQAAGRRCELEVWAGVLDERAGRADAAQACFQAGVEAGAPHYIEHLYAALRLASVRPAPPRPALSPVEVDEVEVDEVEAEAKVAVPSAPPAPATAAVAAGPTLVADLERLARLRDQGLLSPEEFAAAKRRMLGGG